MLAAAGWSRRSREERGRDRRVRVVRQGGTQNLPPRILSDHRSNVGQRTPKTRRLSSRFARGPGQRQRACPRHADLSRACLGRRSLLSAATNLFSPRRLKGLVTFTDRVMVKRIIVADGDTYGAPLCPRHKPSTNSTAFCPSSARSRDPSRSASPSKRLSRSCAPRAQKLSARRSSALRVAAGPGDLIELGALELLDNYAAKLEEAFADNPRKWGEPLQRAFKQNRDDLARLVDDDDERPRRRAR